MSSGATNAKHRYAKTLNELTKNGLEPSDPAVRDKYDEFKVDVTKQALQILRERIPAKILYFNEQVNITSPPGDILHTRDLDVFAWPLPLDTAASSSGSDVGNGTFLADGDETNAQLACSASHSNRDPPSTRHRIPLNSQVVAMGERVRRDALELIEMVGIVRLWIQLNVPRIEDGNNFGVAIQEEAIQELGRVEDAAFNLCDGIKYHMARAKLISKVLKYPGVADYVQSVIEVDRKEWIHLKVSLVDMRNSYSMLYDLLHKASRFGSSRRDREPTKSKWRGAMSLSLPEIIDALDFEHTLLSRLIFKHQHAHRRTDYLLQLRWARRCLRCLLDVDIRRLLSVITPSPRCEDPHGIALRDCAMYDLQAMLYRADDAIRRAAVLLSQLLQRDFFVPMCMMMIASLSRIHELYKRLKKVVGSVTTHKPLPKTQSPLVMTASGMLDDDEEDLGEIIQGPSIGICRTRVQVPKAKTLPLTTPQNVKK